MTIQAVPTTPRSAQAADWALSHGVASMTTGQAAQMLGVPPSQVPQRLAAAKHRGEWVTPARGLWVPVPPEFRAWAGPPATEFIDALMTHLDAYYYVGWLSAASTYGATHHAPQVTHVATSKLVRERTLGRARLVFHERSGITELPTTARTARSARFTVSSPEVTALDIAADLAISGGLDNAATVIAELADEVGLDDPALASLATVFPDAATRRVGWIVERFTGHHLNKLADHVARTGTAPSRLHPAQKLTGPIDGRWRLRLNTAVDVE